MNKNSFLDSKIGHIVLGVFVLALIGLITYLVIKHYKAKDFEDREKLGKLLGTTVKWNDKQKSYVNEFSKSGRLANMVLELKYAPGTFSDDEGRVYTVFTNLKNLTELEALRGFAQKQFKTDLFTYISSFMNDKELSKVYGIVKKLKPYK